MSASSSDDDGNFPGFTINNCKPDNCEATENEETNIIKSTGRKKSKLVCYECKREYTTEDLNMNKTTYAILQSMIDWGSRWHCHPCLVETKPLKAPKQNNIENKLEKLTTQIQSMNTQIKSLTEAQRKPETSNERINPGKSSFAEIINAESEK